MGFLVYFVPSFPIFFVAVFLLFFCRRKLQRAAEGEVWGDLNNSSPPAKVPEWVTPWGRQLYDKPIQSCSGTARLYFPSRWPEDGLIQDLELGVV